MTKEYKKLHQEVEAVIKGFLDKNEDFGIEFASDNSIIRQFIHVATDMIED